MTNNNSPITQTGSLSFAVQAVTDEAVALVQEALSGIRKVIITEVLQSKISGHYRFSKSQLLPLTLHIAQSSENLTLVKLEFDGADPVWQTEQVRQIIGQALTTSFDAGLQSPGTTPGDNVVADKSGTGQAKPALARGSLGAPSDYKTTTVLGKYFAVVGWLGVGLSICGTFALIEEAGSLALGAGFISALFCLLTVAAGQLMRTQAEIAHNSRLILIHLEKLDRGRE